MSNPDNFTLDTIPIPISGGLSKRGSSQSLGGEAAAGALIASGARVRLAFLA